MAVIEATRIKAKDMERIQWYSAEFTRAQPLAQELTERFERSRIYVEEIHESMGRAAKFELGSDQQSMMRQSEMLAYHLSEARRIDGELALLRNQIAVLREALSLFLADEYGLDVTKEWLLDAEKGILSYDEPVHTGLRDGELDVVVGEKEQ
jgi:hypothetical protein